MDTIIYTVKEHSTGTVRYAFTSESRAMSLAHQIRIIEGIDVDITEDKEKDLPTEIKEIVDTCYFYHSI